MNQTEAVLFDMDGVIVDSERYWIQQERDHIFPETVEGDITPAETTGMNVEDIYDFLDAEFETLVSKAEFLGRYDTAASHIYREEVALMEGFRDLVASLRAAGVKVALVSSSKHDWIEMVLDRFDLHEAFDLVVSAEDIDGASKPEPDIFLHAASRLSVEPSACVVVEDSTHGVQAAVAAGMYCIGYAPDSPGQNLTAADDVANGPADLKEKLLG
ncbi:HAD family phosphatase [Haladaptatus sp. DYSN1]|uniref:HAD family hydrolase n=1 Tax=unclassified Haladaptatus TaxID=2622732 RepID=UPI002406F96C|nr:HAD family phosphatase [Haladaptatus sp. DYSN1]